MEGHDPTVADVDDPGVETGSDENSGSLAGKLFEEWFAGFVAAVLGPLRFEHRPFNLVRLALKLLHSVPDLLIGEIGFRNFH